MTLAAAKNNPWPPWLVDAVRGMRGVFAWASGHTLAGVPVDWIVRFAFIAGLYAVLRRWTSPRRAAGTAIAVLLVKELFDIAAHIDLLRPRAPDLGDLADILSGLAGVAAAMTIDRLRRRPARQPVAPRQPRE